MLSVFFSPFRSFVRGRIFRTLLAATVLAIFNFDLLKYTS